jgi:hypothetical protein
MGNKQAVEENKNKEKQDSALEQTAEKGKKSISEQKVEKHKKFPGPIKNFYWES